MISTGMTGKIGGCNCATSCRCVSSPNVRGCRVIPSPLEIVPLQLRCTMGVCGDRNQPAGIEYIAPSAEPN